MAGFDVMKEECGGKSKVLEWNSKQIPRENSAKWVSS